MAPPPTVHAAVLSCTFETVPHDADHDHKSSDTGPEVERSETDMLTVSPKLTNFEPGEIAPRSGGGTGVGGGVGMGVAVGTGDGVGVGLGTVNVTVSEAFPLEFVTS